MPKFQDKNNYLIGVKARGSVKHKIMGCYLTLDIEIQNKTKLNKTERNKKREKEEKKQKNIINMEERGLTKTKRKSKHNKIKRTLKKVWTTKMET